MFRRLFVLISTTLMIGCASASPPNLPTQQPIAPTQTTVPTITPTRGPTRTPAIISAPNVTAAPLIVAPPGLLYITGDSEANEHPLWVIDASGRAQIIEPNVVDANGTPDFDISPDGTEMLYAYQGDIWRIDISSGTAFNLTNTADRIEMAPRWVGEKRAFVCGSFGEISSPMTTGQLTYVDLEALTYTVIDEGFMTSIPAPHPDGETILYSKARTEPTGGFDLWQYTVSDGSVTAIDPIEYGLADYAITDSPDDSNTIYTEALSWSADGSKLGMALTGMVESEMRGIILVMDWATKAHEVLHVSLLPGIDAPLFNSAPRFSTAGDWVVFQAPPAAGGSYDIFVADAGGTRSVSGDHILRGQWAELPSISRDDQWVAFLTSDGLALMRVGEWNPIVTSAQDVVIGVGWVTPPD